MTPPPDAARPPSDRPPPGDRPSSVDRPPPGFATVRAGGAVGWIRTSSSDRSVGGEAAVRWLEWLLERGGDLAGWAASHPDALVRQGRAPVHAAPAPLPLAVPGAEAPARWLVRHYRRGGAMAPILGDRYLRVGHPRPFREAEAAEEARRRGVPTPAPMAAVVRTAVLFYRGDLATAFVPGTTDLRERLFGDSGRGAHDDVDRALRDAGRLVGRLSTAGVEHPDLNAMNVLPASEGAEAQVLDLDRARILPEGSRSDPEPMIARLLRSLRKEAGRAGRPVPPDAERIVREGVADPTNDTDATSEAGPSSDTNPPDDTNPSGETDDSIDTGSPDGSIDSTHPATEERERRR